MDFLRLLPHVLCFSRDQRLLETRGMVLSKHYNAELVGSIPELKALSPDTHIDTVILCHSLSPEECDLSASIVRERWPKAKILAVSGERPSCWTFADKVVSGIDGPSVLLQAIDSLVRPSLGSSDCI